MVKSANFFLADAMEALLADVALFGFLIASSISDLRTRRVPNALIVAMILCWMLIAGAGIAMGSYSFATVVSRFFEALILGGLLLLITCLFERITQSFAMGGGDIKLIACTTLYVGFGDACIALLIACSLFACTGLFKGAVKCMAQQGTMHISQDHVSHAELLPFIPALALGVLSASILKLLVF